MLQVYKLLVLQEHSHLEFFQLQSLRVHHVLQVTIVDKLQLIIQKIIVLLVITVQKAVKQLQLMLVLQALIRPNQD